MWTAKNMLFVCGLVLLRISACSANEVSDVVVLDLSNFNRLTKDGIWFVEFYAPWCGHCKAVAPIWEQVAKTLKGTDIRIAKADAHAESKLADDFGIEAFPTFKLFVDGVEHSEYKGKFEANAFIQFAKRAQQTSAIVFPPQNWQDVKDLGTFAINFCHSFAVERLLLYSFIITLTGFAFGVLVGVLLTLREKEKLM